MSEPRQARQMTPFAVAYRGRLQQLLAKGFQEAERSACPECNGLGWSVEPDGGVGTARRCACRTGARSQSDVAASLIGLGLTAREIDDLQVPWGGGGFYAPDVFAALTTELPQWARRIAAGEVRLGDPWVWVLAAGRHERNPSGVGTGKTRALHRALATAVRYRCKVGLMRCRTDLTAAAAQRGELHVAISPMEETWSNCRLLGIDDIGAERQTDSQVSVLSAVIEARYRSASPTILCLNPGGLPADARLESRLRENARWVKVAAPDMRPSLFGLDNRSATV